MSDDTDHPALRGLPERQRALVLEHRETFRLMAELHRAGGRECVTPEALAFTDAVRLASVADNDTDGAATIDPFNGGAL